MAFKLAFVHTSHVLIPLFAQLAKEKLPGIEVFHMVDESLIRNTIASQGLTKSTIRRMVSMIGSAHEGGASAVMVTCSSIGAGVTVARPIGQHARTAFCREPDRDGVGRAAQTVRSGR